MADLGYSVRSSNALRQQLLREYRDAPTGCDMRPSGGLRDRGGLAKEEVQRSTTSLRYDHVILGEVSKRFDDGGDAPCSQMGHSR